MSDEENMFCRADALRNERAVEKNFVYRLIEYLGFPDECVTVEGQVEELVIPRGRDKERHRPDAVLWLDERPKVVIEVKAVEQDPLGAQYQASSYALMLNRRYRGLNPVEFCLLTNGRNTYLHSWDSIVVLSHLRFSDWSEDNERAMWIFSTLGFERLQEKMWASVDPVGTLSRRALEEMTLIRFGAVSDAALSRFLRVAANHPRGYGAAMDLPWHRKAYSELVTLGWIEPEHESDARLFRRLIEGGRNLPEQAFMRVPGFNLTALGKEVVVALYACPELLFRSRVLTFEEVPAFSEMQWYEGDFVPPSFEY